MEALKTAKNEYSNLDKDALLGVIAKLQSELLGLKIQLFSPRKERFQPDPDNQPFLFDEAEDLVTSGSQDQDSDEDADEGDNAAKPTSGKKRGQRKPLPENLTRIRTVFDLPESEKVCAVHGVALEKIGEVSVEKLNIIPARAFVEELVTLKYKCSCCEGKFVAAARDPDPIPKSFASPGLLAFIATAKYADGLPLYRIERIFERYGIEITRTTMARWIMALGDLVMPLLNLMKEDLLTKAVLHADETRTQVLNEPNRDAETQSFMWALAWKSDDPIILFQYHPNRNKIAAKELLAGFKGILVCDGYKVYSQLGLQQSFAVAGCMAHVRRKFWLAEKIAKKEAKKGSPIRASEALILIRKLYAIEERIKGRPPDEIVAVRLAESAPIMTKFHQWLLEMSTSQLPSSPTGKAISYAIGQWTKLNVFLENGAVAIDNNFMESHIRPFVVGRKAWMFSASPKGADASAALYSLVETAKANGIDPYDYFRLIFKELPKAQTLEDFEKLLPNQAKRHFVLHPFKTSL
jgi:transposase